MAVYTCKECGRTYEWRGGSTDHSRVDLYCSAKCERSADAARAAGAVGRKNAFDDFLVGNIKGSSSSSADLGRRMKIIVPLVVIILVIGLIGLAVNGIKNAFSPIKIDNVSASCKTEKEFVSIIEKALSGVSGTVIEGEEYTTYARQAKDAVKKRRGESYPLKDDVYFVKLPDSVNVYIWFQTDEKIMAYVYKTN